MAEMVNCTGPSPCLPNYILLALFSLCPVLWEADFCRLYHQVSLLFGNYLGWFLPQPCCSFINCPFTELSLIKLCDVLFPAMTLTCKTNSLNYRWKHWIFLTLQFVTYIILRDRKHEAKYFYSICFNSLWIKCDQRGERATLEPFKILPAITSEKGKDCQIENRVYLK